MNIYFRFRDTQISSESHNGILHTPHLAVNFLPIVAINNSTCRNSKQVRQEFLRFFLTHLDKRLLRTVAALKLHGHIQMSLDAYRIRIAVAFINKGIAFCGKNDTHLSTDTSCIYIGLFQHFLARTLYRFNF